MPGPAVTILRPAWLFPVAGPPLAGGALVIEGARIAALAASLDKALAAVPHLADRARVVALGNVAVVPGLVNAHTHLEFSRLACPLGEVGMSLAEWIRLLVARRRQIEPQAAVVERREAVAAGLAELVRTGTTSCGEIARTGWPRECFEQPSRAAPPCPQTTVFLESLGLAAGRVAENLASAAAHLQRRPITDGWRAGVSPHAPYTVHPDLLDGLLDLAVAHRAPLAMHLAESPEELQLLARGSGSLVDVLIELDAWDPAAIPRGTRTLDYLRRLARAPRALVVHGNYLDDEEIAFLAAHRERMSLVYCPRTHDYFGHPRYRLDEKLARGVHVAIGTDSRASNPDLDTLAELRHLAARYAALPGHAILRLGTLAGAEALGIADATGSLEPGKRADLALVEVAACSADEIRDPHDLLWHGRGGVAAAMIGGEWSLAPPG